MKRSRRTERIGYFPEDRQPAGGSRTTDTPAPQARSRVASGPVPPRRSRVAANQAPQAHSRATSSPVSQAPSRVTPSPAPQTRSHVTPSPAPQARSRVSSSPAPQTRSRVAAGPAPQARSRVAAGPVPQARSRATSRPAPQASTRTAASRSPGRRGLIPDGPAMRRLMLLGCAAVFVISAFLLIRYFANIAISKKASDDLGQLYTAALQSAGEPEPDPQHEPEPTVASELTDMSEPTDPVRTSEPATRPEPVQAAAGGEVPGPNPEQAKLSAEELWPMFYPQNRTLRVSPVFYELQRENPDIVGWLRIEGVLDEPVCQRDNIYYLTRNAKRQKSVTGCLFLDENCDLKTVPTQMVIHGHNMKEGAMFGSLKKYKVKDASFYRDHAFIEFNTVYENARYVIFAVCEVDIRSNKPAYLPFWQNVRFSGAEEFMAYVEKARTLSHYRCHVDIQPSDRLLTLSTCTGADENTRLLVMARKVREGEDELQLNMSVYSTADR